MQRTLTFLWILIFFQTNLLGQHKPNYPKNYFRNPLNIPMEIVANLGELRADHWHMGLDIRTRQKENYRVYAAASGYIARVRVEPFGYGHSIYINHPNGLTTVYGHLNSFFPALEKYVTEQQYKKESWEIDLNLDKHQFPVLKGQLIALSGSTGSSQGPHVHFEIRNTKSTKCLNPLLFGFPMQDILPPEIIRLAMYDRSRSVFEQSPELFSIENTNEGYCLSQTPIIQTGLKKISFAIQAVDRMKKNGSADGIYSAKLFLDNKPIIDFVLDSIDYNETAYVNAQEDYKYHYNGGVYLQHLSQLPGDHGVVYDQINGNGVIELKDTILHLIYIEVKDAYGNLSKMNFMVQYVDSLAKPITIDSAEQVFAPNQVNVFNKPDFELNMPEFCLYDSVRRFYNRNDAEVPNAVSAEHQLNDADVPLHGSFNIRIKPDKPIYSEWKDKIILRRNDARGSSIRKAEWQGEWLIARFGDFGKFQAFVDTVPPEIKDIGSGDTIDFTNSSSIVVEASDNYGSVRKFAAEIDCKWICFTYDKGSPYIYKFDEHCPYGVHQLKVTVEDLVGNSTIRTFWFKRNPPPPPKKKAVRYRKKN